MMIEPRNFQLREILACPCDHKILQSVGGNLICPNGHRFMIENGIPVFLEHPRRELIPSNMGRCKRENEHSEIDPFVDDWLVNTNGNLYWKARGRLKRYPIPAWPSVTGENKVLLDIGCGWGRWTMSASRAGFRSVGVDIHLDALSAAQRVAAQIGAASEYVCGDPEAMPFLSASMDVVYSYSVFQHLEKKKVKSIFKEMLRILKPGGFCLIQLPNTFGIFNLVRQAIRGFRRARSDSFEMRYWSRRELRQAIEEAGLSGLSTRPDGFFSQNPQMSDLDLLSTTGRVIVRASHLGCKAADFLPLLVRIADSWYIQAFRPGAV
jgi:2-polyprenyl-3-methyl-5-hydroxy-6-metoxy-1,4-benzoquinol methylase/uncharacterized protein YbaR (Trm112 family)